VVRPVPEGAVIRRRVIVSGRVQGVFFRETTRHLAERAGVAGWVRNRPDGTVEAVFEGEPDAVEQLIEASRSGPPMAEVTDVQVIEEEPESLGGFTTD
jgi:acylphosphatase